MEHLRLLTIRDISVNFWKNLKQVHGKPWTFYYEEETTMTTLFKPTIVTDKVPKLPLIKEDARFIDKMRKIVPYYEKVASFTEEELIEDIRVSQLLDDDFKAYQYQELSYSYQSLVQSAALWANVEEEDYKERSTYFVSEVSKRIVLAFPTLKLQQLNVHLSNNRYSDFKLILMTKSYISFVANVLRDSNALEHEAKELVDEIGLQFLEPGREAKVSDLPFYLNLFSRKSFYTWLQNYCNFDRYEKVFEKFLRFEKSKYQNAGYTIENEKQIATIRGDKKYQNEEINRNTTFLQHGFRKVEVDTVRLKGFTFDFDEFKELEKIWEENYDKFPISNKQPELKFRKLGKHHATGLYLSRSNIIAIDVRDTTSFVHEYGHYLDYTYGDPSRTTLSLREDFLDVVEAYVDLLSDNLNPRTKKYLSRPTEVFARGFEFWVSDKTMSETKLQKNPIEYLLSPEYIPFLVLKDKLYSFFEEVFSKEPYKHEEPQSEPSKEQAAAQKEAPHEQLTLF